MRTISWTYAAILRVLVKTWLSVTKEDCISYINEDELVEVTPKAIRLRKRHMRKWYGANAY